MSFWRERAKRVIASIVADLPDDVSLKERKKALWGKGGPAHQNTSWGRKMWGKEVRAHLIRHGDQSYAKAQPDFQWPGDIAFPYREQSNG